jgi:hypothetical protein
MPVDQDALAALAARMVVAAASTDAWGTAQSGVAPLLGRGDPEQERRADRRLDQTRDQIQAAAGKELEQARADLEAVWRTRLADLLEEQPDAAGELGEVVKQIQAASPVAAARPWRQALRPLPEIVDWYKANPFAGTLLAAGFVVLKCYVVARGDLATALGILQYTGVGAVVAASALSSLPILTAAALAYAVFHVASRRPWRQLLWVMAGAFVLTAVFAPWTYLALAVLIGVAAAVIRRLPARKLATRLLTVLVAGVGVVAVIVGLYTVWVPHEIVTFRPGTLPRGKMVEVGYVLSEDNGWITMLTTGLGEEHRIIRVRDAAVKKQAVCERRPVRGHSISLFTDAVSLWRLVTRDYSLLRASVNPSCPYQGL